MAALIRELNEINFQIRQIEELDLYERLEDKLVWLEKRKDEILAELEAMKF